LILRVDLGFYIFMENEHFRFRILGMNAPELKGASKEAGEESKDYLKQLLEGQDVIIRTEKTDSFGRWLATISYNDMDIAALMISQGLANPYKF